MMAGGWTAAAIAGSAVLGYLGSQNAASAQRDAAGQASATSQSQYNQTRQDQLPWMNRGNAAGNMLAYLMGLPGYGPSGGSTARMNGGTATLSGGPTPEYWVGMRRDYGPQTLMGDSPTAMEQDQGGNVIGNWLNSPSGSREPGSNFTMDESGNWVPDPSIGGYGSLARRFSLGDFKTDPGYMFRLSEGQKALERSAAAKGMSLSGAQLKALTGYNQNFASNEYGNAYNRFTNDQTNLFNRLSGIAGTGQQANQFVGQMGANTANQIGQNQLAAGNAAAAGWVGGTNALSNGLNTWNNWNMWNQRQSGQPSSWSYSGMGG